MATNVETLRRLIHRESALHPHLTSRLEKAATIVILREITSVGGDTFRVRSEDNLTEYDVSWTSCGCPDFVRFMTTDHHCKHRLAVILKHVLELSGVLPQSIIGWIPNKDASSHTQAVPAHLSEARRSTSRGFGRSDVDIDGRRLGSTHRTADLRGRSEMPLVNHVQQH